MNGKLFSLLALGAAAIAAPASAQMVHFQGTTEGCFGASCTPVASSSVGGLTYTGGSFNQNSDTTGFLAIGGASNNLGFFDLTSASNTYTGDLFTLMVNFTAPGTASGSYSATLHGQVVNTTSGGIAVNFSSPLTQFLTSSGGNFTMTIPNSVSVTSDSTNAYISADFQAVPEPATWAMMLVGFGAIGAVARRRRSAALAQLA